jgi:hypothetical protein
MNSWRLNDMARPIRATPRLNKEESEEFVKEMHRVDNSKITKADKEISKDLDEPMGVE